MAKPDIWMPLYIGDYLSATTHLSAEESGAYLHLLMHQWKNGSLPADSESLRRIARVDKDAWSIAWAVLGLFFDHAQGFPVQLRLERIRVEWQDKKTKSEAKATAAANARWAKQVIDAPSIASSTPQAMPQPCPSSSSSPTSIKSIKNKATSAFVLPEWVPREQWDAYMEVRKLKKHPRTDHALGLLIGKLEKFRGRYDLREVINASIEAGWASFFEPKSGFAAQPVKRIVYSDPEAMNA